MSDLPGLIDGFTAARAAFLAADDDDADCPEWEAYETAEDAVLVYPCATIEDVRLKARFFLDNEVPNETLRSGIREDAYAIDVFLRSLLGEGASCD